MSVANYSTILTENNNSNLRILANQVSFQTWGTNAIQPNASIETNLAEASNVTVMTIRGSNVGIGSTLPAYRLDVNGNIRFTGNLYRNDNLVSLDWIKSGGTLYVLNSNVGIGTTNTQGSRLYVQGMLTTSNITVTSRSTIPNIDTTVQAPFQVRPASGSFVANTTGKTQFWVTHPGYGVFDASPQTTEVYVNGVKLAYSNVNIKDYDVDTSISNDGSVTTSYIITTTTPVNSGDVVDITVWPTLPSSATLRAGYLYQNINNGSLWTSNGNNAYYSKTGNVGIGTTNPQGTLHIYRQSGTTAASLVLENQAEASSATPVQFIKFKESQGTANYDSFGIACLFGNTGDNNKFMITSIASPSTDPVTAQAKLTIEQGGSVGIGTTSPQGLLEVRGGAGMRIVNDGGNGGTLRLAPSTSSLPSTMTFYTYNNYSGPSWIIGQGACNVGASNFGIGIGGSNTPAMSILATNGNIGIGTTLPLSRLHVHDSTTANAIPVQIYSPNLSVGEYTGILIGRSATTNNAAYFRYYNNTSASYFALGIMGSANHAITYTNANNTNPIVVLNSTVGISTGTPLATLHVNGTSMLVGTQFARTSYQAIGCNIQIPTANGVINNVNITALNKRTRASYGSTLKCVNTWMTRASAANNVWNSVCWAPEIPTFVAVSSNATTPVMTSADGVSWVTQNAPSTHNWTSVCWSPELQRFVAVASRATSGSSNLVMTSSNATTWTLGTSTPGDPTWSSVCWGSESAQRFVAVANSTTPSSTCNVMQSADGISWSTISLAGFALHPWTSVCWAPEIQLFVSVSSTGRYMTSADGISWTTGVTTFTTSGWNSVCWSPELSLFAAVASNASPYIMTSPNGTTWTSRAAPASIQWKSVCWSPEMSVFVAVSKTGTGNRVMVSPDGITWTTRSTTGMDNQWNSICWAGELSMFVGVSGTGTGNRVLTSDFGLPNSLNTPLAARSQFVVNSSTGNVGIGTTNTTPSKLNVFGSTILSSNLGDTYSVNTVPPSNNIIVNIENVNTATNSNIFTGMRMQLASGNALGSGGRVVCDQRLIRKTAATSDGSLIWSGYTNASVNPAYQDIMELNTHTGNLTVRGDITGFNTFSDARLKTNLAPINNALERINKLHPVEYTWCNNIPNISKRDTSDVGLIAQDVAPLFPLVITNVDVPGSEAREYLGIKYEKLVPYIIKSIQELHEEVQHIKSMIE